MDDVKPDVCRCHQCHNFITKNDFIAWSKKFAAEMERMENEFIGSSPYEETFQERLSFRSALLIWTFSLKRFFQSRDKYHQAKLFFSKLTLWLKGR